MNKKISSLTIITSGKCNLNCNYCFLYKNNSYKNFDNLIQESWKNQFYLLTIEKVLDKLKIDLNQITHITLWGGEPLLNLENFNKNIKQLFSLFPNLNHFWTSTNLFINVEKLIEMFLLLDKYSNEQINFDLQISMDSIYADIGHNLPIEFYQKKLKFLFEELNKIYFSNLKIKIYFRPTLDEKVFLIDFQNQKKIQEFINFNQNLINYLKPYIINKNIIFEEIYLPTASYPSQASTEDGLNFTKILQLYNINLKYKNICQNSYSTLGSINRNLPLFSSNYECGNLITNITILPDGTIPICGNGFISTFEEYQNLLENKTAIDENRLENYYSFNPLKLTDKELKRKLYFIQQGVKNNNSTYSYLAMQLSNELALSDQILSKYKTDKTSLYTSIKLISQMTGCMYYNLHDSQLPYIPAPSYFRKYLNGVTEYVQEKEKQNLNEALKDEYIY